MPDDILPNQQPITEGKAFAELLLSSVRQANTEILIDTFTFEFDAVGQALLAELEYACVRGLRVCCLIDGLGSAAFIREHPALLHSLETVFRIRHGKNQHGNHAVFDRRLAVVGSHALREPGMVKDEISWLVTGASAATLALEFDSAWEQSRE